MLRISPEPQLGCELPSPPVLLCRPECHQPISTSKPVDHPFKPTLNRRQKSSTHISVFGVDTNFRRRMSSPSRFGHPAVSDWKILVAGFYKRVDATWSTVKDQEAITSKSDKEAAYKRIAQIIVDAKKSTLLSQGNVDLLITYLQMSGILDKFTDFILEFPQNSNYQIFGQYLNIRNVEYLAKNGKLNFIVDSLLSSPDVSRYLPILETISCTPIGRELFSDKMQNFCQFLWNSVVGKDGEKLSEHMMVIFTNFALVGSKNFQNFADKNMLVEILSQKIIDDPFIDHYRYLLLSILISRNRLNATNFSDQISTSISKYIQRLEFEQLFERIYQEKFCNMGEFTIVMMSELMAQNEKSEFLHDILFAHFRIIWHHAKSICDFQEIFQKIDCLRKIIEHDRLRIEEPEIPAFQWSCEKVSDWLCKIGFEHQKSNFVEHRIDGDLLFSMNDFLLKNEFSMQSSYDRLRFMRELDNLKVNADYNTIDPTAFDIWLTNIQPQLSIYTYCMLKKGLDRKTVRFLNENLLLETFGVENPIQRRKIMKTVQQEFSNDRIFR
uniref:SAM domain-containing protein n=1 Tax=Romanomermis culicivorax TaxID=13658 RepID=A0A915KQI0_ROMCU